MTLRKTTQGKTDNFKKTLVSYIIIALFVFQHFGCATKKTVSDEDFDFESDTSSQSADSGSSTDEFSDFEANDASSSKNSAQATNESGGDESEFEKALNDSNDVEVKASNDKPTENAENQQAAQTAQPENPPANQEANPPAPEVVDVDQNKNQQADKAQSADNVAKTEPSAADKLIESNNTDQNVAADLNQAIQEQQAVPNSPPPVAVESSVSSSEQSEPIPQQQLAKVTDVRFVSNKKGGTLLIKTDREVTYKTRTNNQTKQVVIELENVVVPEKFKRPLVMKDMSSNIKSVDVYQSKKSSIGRFVVQLSDISIEPLVQPEGNSVLVMANTLDTSNEMAANSRGSSKSMNNSNSSFESSMGDSSIENNGNAGLNSSQATNGSSLNTIMTADNLEDFLMGNNKYFGKAISIEVTDMDIRDILKFISEESGINMIFDDNISGRGSYKLRNVPWDQALVTIMKSKKLGYRRQGDILRIAPIDVLAKEEEDAVRLKDARRKIEPLVVRNFQINYADISTLEGKIKDFIKDDDITNSGGGLVSSASRGKVTADARTNTLIVTDTSTKLKQVEQLISVLDSQPQQVLIEGRVVEASEDYSRAMGFNYGLNTGTDGITGSTRVITNLGSTANSTNPLNISPSMTFTPSATGSFTSSLWFGQLGAFGDLSAKLILDEHEQKIKILSSPRINVLHNQTASINQTKIIRVPTSDSTSTSTGTVTQVYKDVAVGVKFDVKPIISSEGTVNLDLKIEKSAADSSANISQRDMKTNIIVKDGDTAIIGGVFTSETTVGSYGIPGLKDIPILGFLFKSDTDVRSKTELMFFVSPKILKNLVVPSNAKTQNTEEVIQ